MKPIAKFLAWLGAFSLLIQAATLPISARTTHTSDINVPDGYKVEVAVNNLSAPSMVAFDDQGRMLVAETGYDDGGEPKVTRIDKDGTRAVLARGSAFGNELPVTAVTFFEGRVYVAHGGSISLIKPDGTLDSIISGIKHGDHQANQIVFKDGKMYLAVGTPTNSGVVGPDNAIFGWLKMEPMRGSHDVPCRDITLTGNATFEYDNPIESDPPKVKTSAYAPFKTELPAGTGVKGDVKCNGAILRANPDGSQLEVFAWGFRNPYGLEVGPDGAIYTTMHGFDARGVRPIENAWDCFYKVQEGAWYGWPDFACDIPVTDPQFKPKDKPQPQFLISNHPTENPPKPIAKFNPHAAANGFAFAANENWGNQTDAYIALFGDFTPATGTVDQPQGVKIVKVDTITGRISDFMANKLPGQASRRGTGGLEHPSDVTFGPDGAMYIADWGVARVSEEGLKLDQDSGVVWKITWTGSTGLRANLPAGISFFITLLGLAGLALVTWIVGQGPTPSRRISDGAKMGTLAGLALGVFAMLVAAPALDLPWFAPPRVMATMLMGGAAVANILEFEPTSFFVGIVVVLILGAVLGAIFAWMIKTVDARKILLAGILFGLTSWAVLQYLILPVLFPLVTEKGFPPEWYAASFTVYGAVLGWLLGYLPHRQRFTTKESTTVRRKRR